MMKFFHRAIHAPEYYTRTLSFHLQRLLCVKEFTNCLKKYIDTQY